MVAPSLPLPARPLPPPHRQCRLSSQPASSTPSPPGRLRRFASPLVARATVQSSPPSPWPSPLPASPSSFLDLPRSSLDGGASWWPVLARVAGVRRRVRAHAGMRKPGIFGRLSKTDRLLICWWAFTGLTHILIEGPFVFTPDFFMKDNPNFFDEVWKEYSKGDSRYLARDAATVTIEGITAILEGPASLLAVYSIASQKSFSHILQFAVCLGQLYGCLVYFITAYLDGFNFWVDPFYFWAYFIGGTSFWIWIPMLIAIRSWKKTCAAFQAEKVKTK